ncbi:MAG: hypothetical protein IJ272_03410 [Clostridia bacterium]|nr:hypothetical protein [Clostridia bacterium]
MSEKLLKVGDVIRLEKGMKVYAFLPEKFVYSNRPFSDEITQGVVCIGEPLYREAQSEEQVKKYVREALKSFGLEDYVEETSLSVKAAPRLELDTLQFVGEYYVISTACEGGGSQNGPNSRGDTYPNGHHVICQKRSEEHTPVHFYQTGAFTAMIEDITPINVE